ncbi:HAD-IA family hydrolase [Neisseria sp. ZJ106]|uniref:HAD-IA family hydrolase n=1 Tax=Neisseria lisongii TaxID=2912188 RepID=A0ABY7RJD8_9NEIS|nr:HAD-IA family hydrolase [Neisseria lisongii]MCF7521015.1 HAD-IA family hydrolase [Neisseria lisongii]WCL71185.1 HAD-IA family hydrolase [Neisseria lisongii]
MQPKLIIFDWDGTLADTTSPIVHTFQHSFAECGQAVPDDETVRSLIGYSLPEIIRRLLPEADTALQHRIAATYSTHYLNPNNHNMTLFDDALPCLNALKAQGYWLAVATGKGRSGLDNAIRQTQTAGFWLATTCAGEQPSKPAPNMVLHLCDQLGVMPSESIVIGDTTYDLEMAAHAKARAIGITTGAHTAEQLRSCPHLAVLNRLAELPDFLATL